MALRCVGADQSAAAVNMQAEISDMTNQSAAAAAAAAAAAEAANKEFEEALKLKDTELAALRLRAQKAVSNV